MTTTSEVDPMLKKAIILLHSPDPNSATELRMMIDELIKQRFGPSKMLANTLSKEQLDLEKNFPGMQTTPEPSIADEVINLTNSPAKTISDSPDTIVDSDDGGAGGITSSATVAAGGGEDGDVAMLTLPTSEEVENLKEFGDLNCCVCGEMMFTANNRLIECSQCGALYHQDCHKPAITNEETAEDQVQNWQCNSCNDKPSTSKAAVAALAAASTTLDEPISLIAKTKSASASSSRSSSSSNSSSPFYKQEHSSSSSSKHHKSSSSSSKSNKKDRAASSAIKSSSTVPAINVSTVSEKSSSSTSSKKSSSHTKHHESKRKISK